MKDLRDQKEQPVNPSEAELVSLYGGTSPIRNSATLGPYITLGICLGPNGGPREGGFLSGVPVVPRVPCSVFRISCSVFRGSGFGLGRTFPSSLHLSSQELSDTQSLCASAEPRHLAAEGRRQEAGSREEAGVESLGFRV